MIHYLQSEQMVGGLVRPICGKREVSGDDTEKTVFKKKDQLLLWAKGNCLWPQISTIVAGQVPERSCR